jgi:CRP-like cAMP-binding protein
MSARPTPRGAAVTYPGRESWPEGSLLALLPESERAAMLSAGLPVQFGDDDFLVRQGDVGEYCYLLTDGMVKVTVAAESGAETTLAMRGPGDLIGEFAVIDGKPRTATAIAVGQVTAIRISRTTYDSLSQRHPLIVAQHLVAKLRAETDRHVAERTWEARQLLAQVLYEFAEDYGKPIEGGAVLAPITQAELGKLAGVGVSTTERELAKLRKAQIIDTHYGRILVRDMDYLREIRFKND